MTISDVVFKNFKGTTSKKYNPKVGTLVCSSPSVSLLQKVPSRRVVKCEAD